MLTLSIAFREKERQFDLKLLKQKLDSDKELNFLRKKLNAKREQRIELAKEHGYENFSARTSVSKRLVR